jgi:hypothetical protein
VLLVDLHKRTITSFPSPRTFKHKDNFLSTRNYVIYRHIKYITVSILMLFVDVVSIYRYQ